MKPRVLSCSGKTVNSERIVAMEKISGGVCAAKGFTASGVHAGIRKNKDKKDLALIVSEKLASAASTYTQNLV